jgi:ribose transport system substrate-binding protein
MQDYLAKYPQIDAVWANDDDMLLGVLEAVKESGRKDIKLALGGNGMKDIVKKVIDGDAMTPVETPYPPAMIKTAIYMTVANLVGQAPVRGAVKLDAPLITQENAEEYYFPDSPF